MWFNFKLISTLSTSTTSTLVSVSLLPLSIVQGSLGSGYPLAFETLCPSDTFPSAFPFIFSVAFSSVLPLESSSYLASELVSCLALCLLVSALDDLPVASGLSLPPRSASPSLTWLVLPPTQASAPQIVAMLILRTFPTPRGRGARPSIWPFNSGQLCSSAGTRRWMMFVDHIDDRGGELQNGRILCTASESIEAIISTAVPYFGLIGHDGADVVLLQCLDEASSGPP